MLLPNIGSDNVDDDVDESDSNKESNNKGDVYVNDVNKDEDQVRTQMIAKMMIIVTMTSS